MVKSFYFSFVAFPFFFSNRMTFLKYNSRSTKFILSKHAVQWLITALIGEQLLYQAVFVPAAVVGLCRSSREQRCLRRPGAAELPGACFLLPTSCCSEGELLSAGHGRTASPDDGRPRHPVRGGGAESQAGTQEQCEGADIWVAWRRAGEC